jgi:hypothetical protein
VLNLVLILQQPVNCRLVAHRLDDFSGRFAMDYEKGYVVEVVL